MQAMSCCHRKPLSTPTPRWPDAPAAHGATTARSAALPPLRYTGTTALSLPVGTRRITVHPGAWVDTPLTEAEHQRLWRSGLFDTAA
jgi:hypothetical protein